MGAGPNGYFQNYTNSNGSIDAFILGGFGLALSIAATAATGGSYDVLAAIIGALALIVQQSGNGITLSIGDQRHDAFWYATTVPLVPTDNELYYLGTSYDGGFAYKLSYAFSVYFEPEYAVDTGGTSSNPYIGQLEYTTSMNIVNTTSYDGYLASDSLFFMLGGES